MKHRISKVVALLFLFMILIGQAALTAEAVVDVEANNSMLLDLSDEDEIDFVGAGWFVIAEGGQSTACNVGFNFRPSSYFEEKYPEAHLDFLTFNGGSFERRGTLYLYGSEDLYIYEIVGTKVKDPGFVWDEGEGAWMLQTKTLGAYIFSDVPLPENTNSSATTKKSSSNSQSSSRKGNPLTGRC